MGEESLEQRAKNLLRLKISGYVTRVNPFADSERVHQELSYLLDKGYVSRLGETPKSLGYSVTEAGRKWALQK